MMHGTRCASRAGGLWRGAWVRSQTGPGLIGGGYAHG